MTMQINWPGYSGRNYTFETYPIGTAFKPIGGVYIFCRARPDGKWDALYVGETGNFNERLNTSLQGHQAWPACRVRGATHIGVMIIGSVLNREPRLALETELRHTLNPPCNRQAA